MKTVGAGRTRHSARSRAPTNAAVQLWFSRSTGAAAYGYSLFLQVGTQIFGALLGANGLALSYFLGVLGVALVVVGSERGLERVGRASYMAIVIGRAPAAGRDVSRDERRQAVIVVGLTATLVFVAGVLLLRGATHALLGCLAAAQGLALIWLVTALCAAGRRRRRELA